MNWFSNEYVNKEAVKGNIIQLFLYKIAYPLSTLFVKLNITPNTITVFSIIFAVISFLALILDNGFIYFTLFWTLSIHLDYCDGTVARMTGNLRKSAFRFDHMSDIIKIGLIIFGVGIRYQTISIWLLSFMSMFSFLYLTIVSHELGYYKKSKDSLPLAEQSNALVIKNNSFIIKLIRNNTLLTNLYSFFFTLNGHTLLWFFLISLGPELAKIFLVYFLLLSIFRVVKGIKMLSILPKI